MRSHASSAWSRARTSTSSSFASRSSSIACVCSRTINASFISRRYARCMRLRAEPVLAWAGAGVGVVAVVSALTPAFADGDDVVRGVLPAGIPSAARVVTLAFGLGLVWLSRSLAQRRRRAWQLAVAVVIGLSVSHLIKGLDFEEALVTLALLVALARYRR